MTRLLLNLGVRRTHQVCEPASRTEAILFTRFMTISTTAAAALGLCLPATLVAQSRGDSVVVLVAVLTESESPIAAVDVAISRSPGVGAILAKQTNQAGLATFKVERSNAPHVVMTRKIGWTPAERPVEIGKADSVHISMHLRPAAVELDAIVVEAKRPYYILAASEIAASRRPVRDALEALQKLKPAMLYDRDRCPGEVVDNVWINGRRILFMASNTPILGGRSSRTIGNVRVRTQGGRAGAEPPAVDSVLASIRVEHVQDIRLVNCWDTSLPGVGSNNALYVSLKPGVDWDWKHGSFVPESLFRIRR